MSERSGIDKIYLISILVLTFAGFFIFSSASLGLLARDGASFKSVALNQTIGLSLGLIVFFIMSKLNYKILKKYSFYIFISAILINLLLFIPAFTLHHGGASRWIDLGFVTFQPSEFLKVAFIIYFASWLSFSKDKVKTFKHGILPYLVILGLLSILLIFQSDTDTLVVIAGTGMAMLFASGARIRDLLLLVLSLLILVGSLAYSRPYIRQRIATFINPSIDAQGSGYQIQQSLIAIGSGQISGRGYGQSVQKFNYLPEPIGDSIFAVAAEEFGFIGSVIIILMFISFVVRGFRISIRAPDMWSGLTTIGIVILIVTESFMNISSMVGILPLSGMPLLFISHGGTALIVTLLAVGIVANISKFQKTI